MLGFSALFASYGAAFGGRGAVLSHQRVLLQVLGGLTILLGLLFAGVFDRFPLAGRMLRPSLDAAPGRPGRGAAAGRHVRAGLDAVHRADAGRGAVPGGDHRFGRPGSFPCLRARAGYRHPVPGVAVFQRAVRLFPSARQHARLVTRAGGALLVIVGVLQVSGAWAAAMTWLKIHWTNGHQPPL